MGLIEIIRRHTDNSFKSIEILFNSFDESEWIQISNGFPIWQQFYHTVNSMDRMFIDPENYQWPEFHKENMNNLEYRSDIVITKHTILEYYKKVKNQINEYLEHVSEDELYTKSHHKEIDMTKLDHILAQFRHMTFHFGYLHSCAKVMHGQTPDHILI